MKETLANRPCKSCPFLAKENPTKEDLGGASVETYIGQARGPFWLPCHSDKNYAGKQSNPDLVTQCRGAAIFRANIGVAKQLPEPLLRLNSDLKDLDFKNNKVYRNEFQFYWRVHKLGDLTEDKVEKILAERHPHPSGNPFNAMRDDEMRKIEVFTIKKIKLT